MKVKRSQSPAPPSSSSQEKAEEKPKPKKGELRGGVTPFRGKISGIDWEPIKERFITGDESMQAISDDTGVKFSSIRCRSSKDKWLDARREHRALRYKAGREADIATTAQRHVEAVNCVYNIRMLIAKKLYDRVSAPGYVPSVADLEKITRLERDLDMPGWTKSQEEKENGSTEINVELRMESVLDTVRDKRRKHVTVEESGPSSSSQEKGELPAPDPEISNFMLGE